MLYSFLRSCPSLCSLMPFCSFRRASASIRFARSSTTFNFLASTSWLRSPSRRCMSWSLLSFCSFANLIFSACRLVASIFLSILESSEASSAILFLRSAASYFAELAAWCNCLFTFPLVKWVAASVFSDEAPSYPDTCDCVPDPAVIFLIGAMGVRFVYKFLLMTRLALLAFDCIDGFTVDGVWLWCGWTDGTGESEEYRHCLTPLAFKRFCSMETLGLNRPLGRAGRSCTDLFDGRRAFCLMSYGSCPSR